MSREEVYEKLTAVFKNVFNDDTISLNDNITSGDIEGWDSLEHINLIVAVEQEFGIKFSMKEVLSMKNVGEMVDIVISRRGQ